MSTYTDLHNRIRENLTVDYHSRVTTQKISAMNDENLFRGTFCGAFSGGTITQVSCVDCRTIGGLAARQLMVEPFLSVGYDVEAQEPVISSLTAYIEARGTSGWIKDHFDTDEPSDVVVRNALFAPSADIGNLSVSGSSYFGGGVAAQSDLSVNFCSVLDTAEHQLSDLLKDLEDSAKVLAVCLRVNEIKTLAALEDVPEIDYTKDMVEDLFNAVKKIAPHRPDINNFQQLVSSLNMSLGELKSAQTGVSLETRLGMLSESVYAVADYTDSAIQGVKADVTYLSSQISSISPATEARLASVEGRVSAIEGDYLKNADKAALQAGFENRLASEKKLFAQQVFDALSALPSDRQVLDVDTISKVLFDIRTLFDGLKS